MKYFSIYIPNQKTNSGRPSGDKAEAMDEFVAGSIKNGVFISGGGFLSVKEHGAVARRENGKTSFIDGPYAESKELLGGFAMLQYPTREAMNEGVKAFLEVAGDGECVTYQIMEGPPPE